MPDEYRAPDTWPQPPDVGDEGTRGRAGYPLPPVPRAPLPRFVRWLVALGVLLIAFLFFQQVVFKVRQVIVYGAVRLPEAAIAEWAGINANSNYFSVREEAVRRNVNANRYLQFLGMEKRFPSTVLLSVKERVPVAYAERLGYTYVMADDGVILEQGSSLNTAGMIRVSGLLIQRIAIGATPQLSSAKQLASYRTLLAELNAQQATGLFSGITFSDSDDIYLDAVAGFTVHIGSGDYLRAKIGTVRAVLSEMEKQGLTGGVIEATVPGEATYRPENR